MGRVWGVEKEGPEGYVRDCDLLAEYIVMYKYMHTSQEELTINRGACRLVRHCGVYGLVLEAVLTGSETLKQAKLPRC